MVDFDHITVFDALSEASQICTPRLTEKGAEAIVRRLSDGGFNTQECLVAIENCVVSGKLIYSDILSQVRHSKGARLQASKLRQQEQEEEFMADLSEFKNLDEPSCPVDGKCWKCSRSEYCPCIRAQFKKLLRLSMSGQPYKAAMYAAAQKFPGAGFESPGTPEYKRYFHDRCKVCSGEIGRNEEKRWQCVECGMLH